MHFADQLKDPNQLQEYEAVLTRLAQFVDDCSRFVTDAWELAVKRTFPEGKYHYGTIFLLVRHIIETVDGVSVLVAKGSADNCGPLLRSGFEALAGLQYILKEDTERRALAYQVAHVHKKIKLYRKFIPTDQANRQLRAELKDDPLVSFLDCPNIDWQERIEGLKQTFTRPEFAPIQAEWEQLQKERKGELNWYTLFGGPRNLRSLSLQIGKGSLYELLYRNWSDFAHAEGVFGNISKGASGEIVMKPIRSPEGIEQTCTVAFTICLETIKSVVSAFASDERTKYQQRYLTELRPRLLELLTTKVIKIN